LELSDGEDGACFPVITRCYERFRLMSYRGLFRLLRERDGSLSATEAFAVDVIYLLRGPTVREFADCIGISQPNATYKVNNLIQKGYVKKVPSREDRRETHLHVTEKFLRYCEEGQGALAGKARLLKEKFSPEEVNTFTRVLGALLDSLG
jgi:Transcriptional regulators